MNNKRDKVIDAITDNLKAHFPDLLDVQGENEVREIAKAFADDVFEALGISPKEQDKA